MKKLHIYLFMGLILFSGKTSFSQQGFDLKIEIVQNDQVVSGTLALQVSIKSSSTAWSAASLGLGSSNIRFSYDADALSIAESITQQNYDASFLFMGFLQIYNDVTITGSTDGITSMNIVNIQGGNPSFAYDVATSWTPISTVYYTIEDLAIPPNITFIPYSGFPATLIKESNNSQTANEGTYYEPEIGGLPIELLDFTAHVTDKQTVHLNWQTSSEINNDFFTVEKSRNVLDWGSLTTIIGAGTSNEVLNYETDDNYPEMGITYYRLKQTDYDGQFTYCSEVKSVNLYHKVNDLIERVWVNQSKLNLHIYNHLYGNFNVDIINSAGMSIYHKNFCVNKDNNLLRINLSGNPSGFYMISVYNQSGFQSKKFIFISY